MDVLECENEEFYNINSFRIPMTNLCSTTLPVRSKNENLIIK